MMASARAARLMIASTIVLAAVTVPPRALCAQAPTISAVEPPNWWGAHSINPVRLLIRGTALQGARFDCGALRCARASTNAQGTYAFVDVTVPANTRVGAHPLTLRTAAGQATVPFRVDAPLSRIGRFQGFGANDVLYLAMPDRFANGDTSNDRPAGQEDLIDRSRGRYYHGGDLAGLRAKLPYLKSLGITAVWMNPIYDNNDSLNRREVYDGQPITDYHGYGAVDFYGVDEHLGTLAELRGLTDDAHRSGIKIILDMVANHSGPMHPWAKDSPTPTWLHGTVASHPDNNWQTYTLADPYATDALRRPVLDGWFINILPDLNQDDPEVARYIIQNTLWWVGVSGIDGIRQDTWPYVPRTFWRDWMRAIKREYPSLRVVGEVLDGDPAMISFFEGTRTGLDGVRTGVDMMFDFPLHYAIRRVFGEGRSIRDLAQTLAHDQLYRDPGALVTLLGLHDVSRFMSEKGATTAGLKLAFTVLMTVRGTPLVYYGDEIAMPGGGDPDNRRDFPGGWSTDARNAFTEAGRTSEQQDVYAHLQRLIRLRSARPELRAVATRHEHVGEQAFVYRRGATVVAINNDTVPVRVVIPGPVAGTDALSVCRAPERRGEETAITIPARSGCVF